jgi:iron complex transport system substrate-binding protein
VTLDEKPSRVAVLFSSYVQIWTVAGGEAAITVGESVTRGLAPIGTPLVDSNAGKSINSELLLSYAPDFVIASADIDAQVACAEILQAAGIPVAYFRVDSFSDYLHMLDICTQITENRDAYEAHGLQIKAQIEAVLASVEANKAPKILFIRAGAQIAKAKTTGEHFVCDMLSQLGAHNIADDAPLLLDDLSLETVLREDPDFIFISTMGEESAAIENVENLFAGDAWSALRAVREKSYCFLPKDMFQYKPNQKWADAYRYLEEILYGGED